MENKQIDDKNKPELQDFVLFIELINKTLELVDNLARLFN